nr:hypothetical protein BaRGS_012354 [Batillaria attramentaria]
MTFDLGGLLSVLTRSVGRKEAVCPSECSCVKRSAEQIMQEYVTRYLPDMGQHMRPELEKGARATITLLTSWLGTMADIRCSMPPGTRRNLTELLAASSLSFKALKVTCEGSAGLVWDLTPLDAFVNVLEIDDCALRLPAGSSTLAVPVNMWILHLTKATPIHAALLDLTTASQLLALKFSQSTLTAVPAQWKPAILSRIMYLDLSYNNLHSYECEVKTRDLSALNLAHNRLTSVPPCLLDGLPHAHHVSLAQNQIPNLGGLLHNESIDIALPKPRLFSVNLADNQVTNLTQLREIQLLQSLDLSHNQLSFMDVDSFKLSPALSWLDVSGNELEYIPDGLLGNLMVLKHLNLSDNRLRSFSFDQSPISTKLVTLDLRHNLLIYPPYADTGYIAPRPSNISASRNPYFCDCNINVFLQFLSMLAKSANQSWFALGYWDSFQGNRRTSQPFVDTGELTCHMPLELRGVPIANLSFKDSCPLMRGCPTSCRCYLLKSGTERVLVDCTQADWMTELPADLPVMSNTPVELHVNGSNLRKLDHRPYLHLVTELYAGGAKVHSVSTGAIQAMQNITVLQLHDNLLRSLPAITRNITFSQAINITLQGNPWTCGCHDLWMPNWLARHAGAIDRPDELICRWSGKPLPDLSPVDLSCGVFNFVPLLIALSMLLGVAGLVISVMVKYRLEILVSLYTRFRIRPFDMYQYDKRPALFDVFVSFSSHDFRWVVEKLVDQLENRRHPYKLCIHLRDFPVGMPIADSISWAVDNSRCTLLVLTRDFLASEWCRHEFRAAHERLLRDPLAKLLIVVKGPLDARSIDRELRAYLRTHTYLRTEDKWFWSKLEYALPTPQLRVHRVPDVAADGGAEIDLDTLLPAALAAGDISSAKNWVHPTTSV